MIKAKKLIFSLLALSIFVFSFTNCTDKAEKGNAPEVLAPAQIVPIAQAKKMYDNYSERRVSLIQHYEDSINRAMGYGRIQQMKQDKSGTKDTPEATDAPAKFDVARYVSYDYETIKLYLAFVEQEAKKANVEVSTLRFYFSNYPDQPFFDGTKDSILHPRQNSVMLSPTLKKGERDYLFYIDGVEGQQQAVLLTDSFGEVKGLGGIKDENNKSYASMLPAISSNNSITEVTTSFYAPTSLTMNRGQGAPPPYIEE